MKKTIAATIAACIMASGASAQGFEGASISIGKTNAEFIGGGLTTDYAASAAFSLGKLRFQLNTEASEVEDLSEIGEKHYAFLSYDADITNGFALVIGNEDTASFFYPSTHAFNIGLAYKTTFKGFDLQASVIRSNVGWEVVPEESSGLLYSAVIGRQVEDINISASFDFARVYHRNAQIVRISAEKPLGNNGLHGYLSVQTTKYPDFGSDARPQISIGLTQTFGGARDGNDKNFSVPAGYLDLFKGID